MRKYNIEKLFNDIIKGLSTIFGYGSPIFVFIITLMLPIPKIWQYVVGIYFMAWFYDVSYMRWKK